MQTVTRSTGMAWWRWRQGQGLCLSARNPIFLILIICFCQSLQLPLWALVILEWAAASKRPVCFLSIQLEFTPEQIEGKAEAGYSCHLCCMDWLLFIEGMNALCDCAPLVCEKCSTIADDTVVQGCAIVLKRHNHLRQKGGGRGSILWGLGLFVFSWGPFYLRHAIIDCDFATQSTL